jgi:tetratricopeptide (TPR) repeat protein
MLFRKGGAGNHADAERLIDEALAMQRAVLGNDHIEVVETLETQGLVYSAQRKFPQAERSYLDAIDTCRRIRTHEVDCARVHNNLGQTYYLQDRYVEAEREMLAALTIRRAHLGESHPGVAISMSTLANVAAIQGDTDRAVDLAARAVAMLEQAGHGESRETALARNGYADVLHRAHRPEAALEQIDRAIAGWRRINPDERVRRVLMLSLKGQILKALKRREDVQRIVAEIAEVDLPPGTLNALASRRVEEIRDYSMSPTQAAH